MVFSKAAAAAAQTSPQTALKWGVTQAHHEVSEVRQAPLGVEAKISAVALGTREVPLLVMWFIRLITIVKET